jgi:steroid delta-isomerase
VILQVAIDRTIRAYAAAWKARDRTAWLNTFAEAATQEDPVGGGVRVGRQEIGAFWDRAMAQYQSVEIVPRQIVVLGREAALVWTLNARSPSSPRTLEGVDIFTFDDEAQILSVRAYWESPSRRDAV